MNENILTGLIIGIVFFPLFWSLMVIIATLT